MARRKPNEDILQSILAETPPAQVNVAGKLSFAEHSKNLKSLPAAMSVGWLDLCECINLRALPPQLKVRRLTLSGNWNPQHLLAGLRCYRLDLQNTAIRAIPPDLQVD